MWRWQYLIMIGVLLGSMTAMGLTAQEVYKKVQASVYPVYGFNSNHRQRTASGTGVAVSQSMVATNCHIVRGADQFQMKIAGALISTTLVHKDLRNDLCFMQVHGQTLKPVKFRHSDDVTIGEEVYAIGNPHGLEKSISKGIISNKHKFYGGSLLQTDATISFGSSGGGLFDTQGNLIGITRAGHRYKDISFAVPSEWITSVLVTAQANRHAQSLNITIAEQMKKNLSRIEISLEKMGKFGRDKISVFRYRGHCFMVFRGEIEKKPRGLLVWYPENAFLVYFVPYENDVENALRLLIQNQYVDYKKGTQLGTGASANSALPAILQSTDVVAKLFEVSPEKQFRDSNEIFLHYPDYTINYQEISIRFGMKGFKKAFSVLSDRCRIDYQNLKNKISASVVDN